MKQKIIPYLSLFLILFCLSSCVQAGRNDSPRKHLSMNTDWAFWRGDMEDGERLSLDDSQWAPAVLPHIMQLEKKHCGGNILYDGIGWYRRHFILPESYQGKRIAVSFQGIMTSCEIYINEEKVADNHGGYIGTTVDISDKINWNGNNLLAVRVDAKCDSLTPPGKPQGNLDFNYYNGIYRDVEMIISDKLHITDALEENIVAGGGQFITFPQVSASEAAVQVKTHVRNRHGSAKNGKLITELRNANGKVVTKQVTDFALNGTSDEHVEQTLKVKKPHLWHPYDPYLYTLSTRIVADGKELDGTDTPIGIRTIKFDKEKGFYINGEHLYLRGANRHQAYANVGDAASNSMQERDVIDFKRGGYNAVRAAHYPQDPEFLAACDKHGLLVVECIPSWQFYNTDSIFINRVFDAGRRMIRRDRNHPAIVLWETALNESQYPLSFAQAVQEITHKEYPGDQMYTAGDYFGHQELIDCYDVFYKQVSKFPKDGSVMSNYPEDFISIKPLFTREWGDGVGEKPQVSLLENEEQQMKQCRSRLHQLNGNGYFDWCMLDANPHMGGHFVWSYNDYARGCCDGTLYCGVVDINRYPKFSYFMLQSMRDKNISQEGLYNGPMIHIASYNASADYSSSTNQITVYSNCDEVRLFRNDKLVGAQTREERAELYKAVVGKGGSPAFIFDAGGYEKGELKAEGIINGKVAVTHAVRTAEDPHHVEIMVHDAGVRPQADGSDMIPVYFKICDKNGSLVHNSDAIITIDVTGEGELIGGNVKRTGISPQQVEGGVGFAFVRTTKKSGTIRIAASSKGLQSGETFVETVAWKGEYVPDGNHAPFTGDEDQGYVPKPAKWEQEILERPQVEVAKVSASGSETGYPVANIIDGDDRSWWIADSDELPQWVMLELARPTYVSAIRILFMKDSTAYKHKLEYSSDGKSWETLFERECTGWDFKPRRVRKEVKYLRITFDGVSEGRAGLGEVTLFN